MPENKFKFKQFSILQDKCAMKVGTDGVLLGAWIQANNERFILDIGTGTGLIAIMLAQKSNAHIDAIDIVAEACEQAIENVANCPWPNRITVHNQSIHDFTRLRLRRYELIVSNPPYFTDAYKPPVEARTLARHMDPSMKMEDLIADAKQLLSPEGRFCLIMPVTEGKQLLHIAEKFHLYPVKITYVATVNNKAAKRMLIELSQIQTPTIETTMVIQNNEGKFTTEYRQLTDDFYIGLGEYRHKDNDSNPTLSSSTKPSSSSLESIGS